MYLLIDESVVELQDGRHVLEVGDIIDVCEEGAFSPKGEAVIETVDGAFVLEDGDKFNIVEAIGSENAIMDFLNNKVGVAIKAIKQASEKFPDNKAIVRVAKSKEFQDLEEMTRSDDPEDVEALIGAGGYNPDELADRMIRTLESGDDTSRRIAEFIKARMPRGGLLGRAAKWLRKKMGTIERGVTAGVEKPEATEDSETKPQLSNMSVDTSKIREGVRVRVGDNSIPAGDVVQALIKAGVIKK